jgi:hypothetical protein
MKKQLPTAGQLIMWVDNNPSNRRDVREIKDLCARMFDDFLNPPISMSNRQRNLYEEATNRLIDAQMRIVKAITFKDSNTEEPSYTE